ncbi:hypothetical protein Tco_0805415 [Tanacetum coccineum]
MKKPGLKEKEKKKLVCCKHLLNGCCSNIDEQNYKLATKLLAEEQGEISIEERSRLFVELIDKRKKHFAKLRAEEQRRKPPTKTQKRNIMSTYLKNMDGYKHTQLKNKRFEEIQMLFVQKVYDDDKEREDLNQCFEIVLDEEFIVHAILLGVKPAPIVGFQIHRAGRQGSYEIIRANRSTKTYTLFSQLIKEIDREDLENLWKRYYYEGGNLTRTELLLWKLYDSLGIHFVRFENMHIYMLIEKRYPLSPTTITDMLNRKLQADHWNETCLDTSS